MNAESRRKPAEAFLILGMEPKVLITTAVGAIGTALVTIGIILAALHSVTEQVKTLKDDLSRHPPTTAEDLDRVQRQITDTTKGIQQDIQSGLDQIDTQPTITVRQSPTKPATIVLEPAPAAPTAPPTPTPTPRPSPTPRPLLPPLPPLLP